MHTANDHQTIKVHPRPWNKGKITGQKPPLRPKHVWAIRTRLQLAKRTRDLALFNLAIDSKLRGCDLVCLHARDIANGARVLRRALVIQQKTQRPVQFEITSPTQETVQAWLKQSGLQPHDYLFPSRLSGSVHLSTRQYARLLSTWVADIGLDPAIYGTHSLRRTKATIIYRRTKNLRAIQLLLGHSKIESTVRYLGVEVEDALALAEETEA